MSKLPWLCPHCGTPKRYPMALCVCCTRFSNGEGLANTAENRKAVKDRKKVRAALKGGDL